MNRILFLDHIAFLGGGQKSMLALMDGLKERGVYELRLMVPSGEFSDAARVRGYEADTFSFGAIRRSWNPLQWAAAVWMLSSAIRTIIVVSKDQHVQIIHANSLKTAILGGIAARITGRTAVFHTRDFLSAGLFRGSLIAIVYAVCHRIIANSQAVARLYGGDPQQKVSVVYNQIDPVNAPDAQRKNGLRLQHGVSDDETLIGFVGRIHPEKGIESLLSAFKLILKNKPDARLWLIGAPMPGEENYQHKIERTIGDLGIAGQVIVWGWRQDAATLMSCFDLFVLPSFKEPFGRVTVEAMMLGIPVVATAAGGTLEIIDDNLDGLLVPPGDPTALAGRCLLVLNDKKLSERLIANAKEKATRKFGKAQYLEGTLAVYASLAGK